MERSAVLAMENRREDHKQESSRSVDRENTRWIRGKMERTTGWGGQSWTKMFFFQYIGIHVLLKLMLGLKSTCWCLLDLRQTIY
jgi:hypothetical protein